MPLLARRRSNLDVLGPESRVEPLDNAANGLPRSQSDHALRSTPPPQASADGKPSKVDTGSAKASSRVGSRLSRHFSDSHLAARAKMAFDTTQTPIPPVPAVPAEVPTPKIVTPVPTEGSLDDTHKKKTRGNLFKRQKSKNGSVKSLSSDQALSPDKELQRSVFTWGRKSMDSRRNQSRMSVAGEPENSSPVPSVTAPETLRTSRSGEPLNSSSPKPRKQSLFSLPKRDKRKSLFPLPPKVEKPPQYPDTAPATPRASTSGLSRRSASPVRKESPLKPTNDGESTALRATASQTALSKVSFAPPHPLFRHNSNRSAHSAQSSPAVTNSLRSGIRERASTNSTFGRQSEDVTPPTPPTLNGSTRNSTSTSGRASLGGFLTLNRFRNADGSVFRYDSPGNGSKSNSMSISRTEMALPERAEGETAAKYLERLQGLASRNVIAGMLSKSADPFFQNVLRSYTRRFAFFGEPIDMSLRKFLLEAELPKETQQVDRVIQAFADRYHECNPGIFVAPDQAYIIAFSLMMLHTDAFNKNNKYKMQKGDYIKNTRGQYVSEDILACFYDNICYTPFIHFDEDDFDASSDRLSSFKNKKAKLKGAMPDPVKKASGPVDPYSLIIDNKLDVLRPSIKDSIIVEDPYHYLGTAKKLDHELIQRAFQLGGILQIISARSRPAAFETEATRDNPQEAKVGVVDIQVTKVGILWRKAAKRKKARSPWSEWGAILTGSQMYFFKNVSWIKTLIHQYNNHQKHMVPPSPVTFTPPLEDFKPDSSMKIDDAVALVDTSYSRHKNAFTMVRHGGEEEVLLADNETELNEWLALINYAAAFRSAGVRIRSASGAKDLETAPPALKRLITGRANASNGDSTPQRHPTASPELIKQIMAARRKQMISKIAEAEIKITDTTKQLDTLLRDARHLLLLAPIQPRTREVIIHSAARMDAMLKWTRRDIWRTKCYKDILYMDALEDTDEVKVEADKMQPVLAEQVTIDLAPDDAGAELEEVTTLKHAMLTPKLTPRPQSAIKTEHDVFKTPPESARSPGESYSWTLPPLELSRQLAADTTDERQQSVSSAVPSNASGRRASITQMSSASSINDVSRVTSHATNGEKPVSVSDSNLGVPGTPALGSKREHDPLVHSLTATTVSSIRPPSEGLMQTSTHNNATPDSGGRNRANRKSLHRTLRDGLHEGGSIHRHRKGKESASTVKSDATPEGESSKEGTPGLERREGRFLLHGKQASVITFGEGWNSGELRMSVRRDDTRRPRPENITVTKSPDLDRQNGDAEATATSRTPTTVTPSVDHSFEPSESSHDSRPQSISSAARVAAAYMSAPVTPHTPRLSMETGTTDTDLDDDGDERSSSFFDAREHDTPDKRQSALDEKIGSAAQNDVDVAAMKRMLATDELRHMIEERSVASSTPRLS